MAGRRGSKGRLSERGYGVFGNKRGWEIAKFPGSREDASGMGTLHNGHRRALAGSRVPQSWAGFLGVGSLWSRVGAGMLWRNWENVEPGLPECQFTPSLLTKEYA